ncbi:MAG TPA: type II toxin-antitoxin system VapC family toxin [Gemmatimonadaceae bacterium]
MPPLRSRAGGSDSGLAVGELIVPSVVVLEVTHRILQQRDEDAALQAVALLHQGRIVPLDAALAMAAAQIWVAEQLPLADSIILATAREFDATIWTMDAYFDGLPGVKYFRKQEA